MNTILRPEALPLGIARFAGRETRSTRLRGAWLGAARLLWLTLVLAAVGLFVAGVPAYYGQLLTVADSRLVWTQLTPDQERALLELGLSVRFYAPYLMSLELIVVAACVAFGLLVFWRRSDDGMAIFVSLVAILFGTTSVPPILALAEADPTWRLPADVMKALGVGVALLLFYVFPDGRFAPGWTRWLALGWIAWVLTWPFYPALDYNTWPFPAPFLAMIAAYGTGVVAQVLRYTRRSSPIERQQTKWAIYGLTGLFVGFAAFNLPRALLPGIDVDGAPHPLYMLTAYPAFMIVPLLLAPVSLGLAVFRHHLWDVDLIINRTLVYGALTVLLGATYFGGIVLLQQLFRPLLPLSSDLAIVAYTLGGAMLSNPLRARIQSFVDRRFYRGKYDAARALAAFGAAIRDEVELSRLAEELVSVVRETMQPAHASLWLREPAHGARPRE